MNRAKKSRKNLSWQAARRKILNSLFSVLTPTGCYTHSKSDIATDVSGRVMNVLGQYGQVNSNAQPVSSLSVIHQMVDIMGELGCQDLEELVFKYLVKLIDIN